MVLGSMRGSRRAAPVRERQGIRQKAETVLALANTATTAAVVNLMMLRYQMNSEVKMEK